MPKRKRKMTSAEQHREFVKTARELGLPESEAAEAKVFGKVGLGKPKRAKRKKQERR